MKSKHLLRIVIMGVILFLGIRFYYFNYTNEGLLKRILDWDGYSLEMLQKDKLVKFYIEPEWIPNKTGEVKNINEMVVNLYQTKLVLEKVWKTDRGITFSFKTNYALNRQEGNFLYYGVLHDDGSVIWYSSIHDYHLYNKDEQEIMTRGSGNGPRSTFSFDVTPSAVDLMAEGFYVEYYGFSLYKYEKEERF